MEIVIIVIISGLIVFCVLLGSVLVELIRNRHSNVELRRKLERFLSEFDSCCEAMRMSPQSPEKSIPASANSEPSPDEPAAVPAAASESPAAPVVPPSQPSPVGAEPAAALQLPSHLCEDAAAPPPLPASSCFESNETSAPNVSEFERRAGEALRKIWNWIIVGEEFRPKRVAIEYAVATVWLVRSAVLLLLIGFGFFIKYSHDNNLFPPSMRIATVLLAGLGILVFGDRLSKGERYRLLGYGLSGAGTVILYLAIFAASSIYHLLSAPVAFGLMILITVFGALLALRRNSLFIALVAVAGGYATPVLLSTGEKRLPELFAYLSLLAAGSLLLAFYRNWRLLNFTAFGLHYLIAMAALHRFFDPQSAADYAATVLFAAGTFIIFSLLPLGYSLLHKLRITLLETLLLLANTGLFFLICIRKTQAVFSDSRYAAAITLFAALFLAVEVGLFFRHKIRDRNLYLALLALCSIAVALTFPLLLSGAWIAAAWSMQAAALLYLGTRSNSRFLILLSFALYIVTGFQVAVLMVRPNPAGLSYFQGVLERFCSLGIYSLALLAGSRFLRRQDAGPSQVVSSNEPEQLQWLQLSYLKPLCGWSAAIGLLIFFRLEIAKMPVFTGSLQIILAAVLYLILFGFMLGRDRLTSGSAIRGWMTALVFLSILDLTWLAVFSRLRLGYFPNAGLRLAGFLVFAVGLACLALELRKSRREPDYYAILFAALGGAVWFVYSSVELCRGLDLFLPHFVYGGVSILWAIYALALLVSGICFRVKALRVIALWLFGIVVLKALLLDLGQLPTFYRILAFIPTALLLFFGAFAYMRVEKLFHVSEPTENQTNE